MGLTSITFLYLFLPLTVIGFVIFNKINLKATKVFLVVASLVFYAWNSIQVALGLVVFPFLVYLCGKVIENKKSKVVLYSTLLILAFSLIITKYFNYSIKLFDMVFHKDIATINILVPLGMSFIVFEAISYLVDIYRGEESGNIIDTILFITFFPKVISGPIILWKDFKKEIESISFSITKFSYGLTRIIIGIAKKVMIADVLGEIVSKILNTTDSISSFTVVLCGLSYMLEIYYDFSGYSDIAIGLCNIFGMEVKENFNFPYLSKSIGEFFRRWHISLGNFLKEYIYIPLGGNKKGNVYLNLFMVFLVSGIWHGDSFAYILWGVICGLCVIFERYVKDMNWYKKTNPIIKWLVTMTITYFLWLLFMTGSLSKTIEFIKLMFTGVKDSEVMFTCRYYFDNRIIVTMLVGIIGALYNFKDSFSSLKKRIYSNNILYIFYLLILVVIFVISFIYIVNSTYSPFIYFRF